MVVSELGLGKAAPLSPPHNLKFSAATRRRETEYLGLLEKMCLQGRCGRGVG